MPDPETPPSPDATQRIPLGLPDDPHRTVKMAIHPPVVAEASGRTQNLPLLPAPERTGVALVWKLLGGLVLVGGLCAGGYLFLFRGTPPPGPAAQASSGAAVPPGVQTYLDQAKAGDAHAMRMLGVMYYYGLNVPQDQEKGLYWYRQAAEKGSDAAREELAKLQAPQAR